jgi:hypothetical protein
MREHRTALTLVLISFGSIMSCSTLHKIPGAPLYSEPISAGSANGQLDSITITPAAPGRQPKTSMVPTKVIQISEVDPIRSLEKQLPQVKGDRVVIPTTLLRTLLATHKLTDGQCKDLSVQLEALKNIDLEETELRTEQP